MDSETLKKVIERLTGFETITWDDLRRSGSHPVSIGDLIKEARDRLQKLKIDDLDELYSLRISGRERLWGMRIGNVFSVLWWDPEHAVCPSNKKHT